MSSTPHRGRVDAAGWSRRRRGADAPTPRDDRSPTVHGAQPFLVSAQAAKLFFEVRGGDHYFANGPAGDATEAGANKSAEELALLCNCVGALVSRGACAPCPCSFGIMHGSGGHARADARRGAVGLVALAWLRLFLLRDETARSQLATRPGIASNFESSGIETATPPAGAMVRG